MTSVRRALGLSFLERYLSLLLALVSNMALARLLTPHEIGQYSVTLAVVGVAHVLRDFGIGNYLIQTKQLDDRHVGTAFGASLLLGTALFVSVNLSSQWIARFYGEEGIEETMRIVSLNFLILPFCSVRMALLRREMQFKVLMYVSVCSLFVSLLVTVILAWFGFGAISMAVGAVVNSLGSTVGAWWGSADRRFYRPTLTLWRSLMSFGGQSAATQVVTSLSMDANDLVVGKVLGLESVALISRAQGPVNLFHRDLMNAVRNVAMPAFAEAHRRDYDTTSQRFSHSVSLITLFAWTFYGLLSCYSLEALRLLFGPQWDSVAVLVPVFALAGAVSAVTSLIPTLLIAVGRIDLVTKSELFLQPARLGLVIASAFHFQSMIAVAGAFLASAVMAMPVFLFVGSRGVPSLSRGLFVTLVKSLFVSVIAVLPAALHVGFTARLPGEPLPLLEVIGCIGLGSALGIWAAHCIDHPITKEPVYRSYAGSLLRIVRNGLGRRRD